MLTKKLPLYKDRDDVTLTTYVLDDSHEMLDGKKRPAVLVCPGGAYMYCSDREGEPIALAFAAMGYHAFVLRYSINGAGAHPAPMREIGKAMLLIRQHSDEWLVDMEQVALCGFSAGAHNCAMFSVYWDKPVICDWLETEPGLIRPAAAILAYGPYDYRRLGGGLVTEQQQELMANMNLVFLGTQNPDEALMEQVSPAALVSAQTPPTFLWATAGDELLMPWQSLNFAMALADKGVPFELHMYERGEHGLALATQATAGRPSQIDKSAAGWTGLAEDWLGRRFALDIPAQPQGE